MMWIPRDQEAKAMLVEGSIRTQAFFKLIALYAAIRWCATTHVFTSRVRAIGIRDRPISPRSPWQNGIAECLIGTLASRVSAGS